MIGIAGVSGSGKSSLALGILYAEGSRRYLEALSTYTRRRMTQAEKAQVDEVLYVPAALAHIFLPRVRRSLLLTVRGRADAYEVSYERHCPRDGSAPRFRGISLAEACTMTLSELTEWVDGVPDSLPQEIYAEENSLTGKYLELQRIICR